MTHYIKVPIDGGPGAATEADYQSAESGHFCNPSEHDCIQFEGLQVRIRKSRHSGDLILAVSPKTK